MTEQSELFFDHLVIGSGLAGLTTALMLAEKTSGSIAVVTKETIDQCNSKLAQGGIACVIHQSDTFEEHLADTLAAGANLCNPDAVMGIVKKGPERIQWLIDIGAHFTTRDELGDPKEEHKGEFDLGREGGHKKRRILHAGDVTGAEVQRSLIHAVRENPRIKVFENHVAIDLISTWRLGLMGENRCLGAYVFDAVNNHVVTFASYSTTIATGGCGKAYLHFRLSDNSASLRLPRPCRT